MLELVVFTLAGERYGIESRLVREVARLTRFTPVPGTPAFVLGITSLRGEILALFDLRQLLGVVAVGVTDLGRVVVVGENRREFGLLADSASEILTVPRSGLTHSDTAWGRAFVRGVTPEGVIVLSGEALLADPQLTIDLHGGAPAGL
jgi:purine-binding chemotaxis protein CheW